MAWVYILQGVSQRHCFGATDRLDQRISEHQRGSNHTTRRFGGQISLVASREVGSMEEARALERRLKKMKNPANGPPFSQLLRVCIEGRFRKMRTADYPDLNGCKREKNNPGDRRLLDWATDEHRFSQIKKASLF